MNFAGKEMLINKDQISEYWTGEVTFFWQPPPNYKTPLAVSMTGLPVQWLLINLAKLDDLDLIVPPDAAYDSRLEETVRAFQQQHALKPDGIAGPNTIITLNTLTNKNIPTLLSKGLSKGLTKGVGS